MNHKAITELESLEAELHSSPSQNPQNRQNSPFPLESFPPVMRDIIEEAAAACMVPPALPGMVALGCLSTAIGGGVCVESSNGRTLNGNLFILAVALSGTGKGTAYSTIAKPLHEANHSRLDIWKLHNEPELIYKRDVLTEQLKKEKAAISKDGHSGEKYKDLTRELNEVKDDLERLPRVLVGETTEQKLGIIMSGQPYEAIGNHSAEARGLIQIILGKFGSSADATGETMYLAGYSGDPYSIERTSRPDIALRNPCISTMLMIQPDMMSKLTMSDTMTMSGFIPRFIMADVKADLEDDTGEDLRVNEDTIENWSKLIFDALATYREAEEKMMIRLSPEAAKFIRNESNRVRRQGRRGAPLEKHSSYVARYGENLRKIHLLLHIAKHGEAAVGIEADEDTAKDASKIAQWFFHETLMILRSGQVMKLQKLFERIIGLIKKADNKEITTREMKKSHTITENDIKELQDAFPDTLEIIERKPDGGGRPSHILRMVSE